MPKIINTAHCKLIGLCCLKGQERDRVYQEWTERFQEHEAFWLDVQENQTAVDMARAATNLIAQQGITHMANSTLVIAVFLDLTAAPNEKLLREVARVAPRLHAALGCNVAVTAEFGYMGVLAFADTDELRGYVQQTVAVNNETPDTLKPLYLVATSPLVLPEDDNCWKAVTVFLDILRREPSPALLIQGGNPDGDVGFLRYGEYDEHKLKQLTTELKKLEKALSADGEDELEKVLKSVYSGIITDIRARFKPDGNYQPLHPDMIVNGAIKRALARSGHLASYENAKNSTWAALSLTGKNLQEIIMEAYSAKIANAGRDLAEYIEKAGVGVQLEMDTIRMTTRLTPDRMSMAAPQPPALPYKEAGWKLEITDYLNAVVEYAAAKVKFEYGTALCEAYKQVPESLYMDKQRDLSTRLGRVETRLKGVMDRTAFIKLAAAGATLPLAAFFPILGGGTQANWVLTRARADYEELDDRCSGTKTAVYFIDEKVGGLKLVDNAPIKALQVLLFNCDDDRLKDLI